MITQIKGLRDWERQMRNLRLRSPLASEAIASLRLFENAGRGLKSHSPEASAGANKSQIGCSISCLKSKI